MRQQALFFDAIAIICLPQYMDLIGGGHHPEPQQVADFEYLQDKGVLRDVALGAEPGLWSLDEYRQVAASAVEQSHLIAQMMATLRPGFTPAEEMSFHPDEMLFALNRRADFRGRLACIELRARGFRAFSAMSLPEVMALPRKRTRVEAHEVFELAVNHIRVPSDDTPLEAIIELREDEHMRGLLKGFRQWTLETARSVSSLAEAADKLDYLLYEYNRAIELSRMKHRMGVLQSVFVSGAELIEDVAKLRLGKLAGRLCSVGTRRVELLVDEQNAPGRQVSYLVKVSDRLGRSQGDAAAT
jgi:hypothetical protein